MLNWKRPNTKPILGGLAVLVAAAVGLAPALASQEAPPEKPPTKSYYDEFGKSHGRDAGEVAEKPVDVEAAPEVSWVSAGGGSWSDPANWSGGAVPGEGDHAVIDLEGTYTVALDADARVTALTLGAASGTQTLRIPRHALALDGLGTVGPRGRLEIAGGTVTGAGDLVVHGELEWSGGAMSGRGKARVSAGGRLALVGGERKVLSLRHVENAGSMSWSGAGNLVVTFAARIVNQEGATFEIATGALLDVYGPPGPSVENAGNLRVTSGVTPTFETPLVNSGTVKVEEGELHLLQGYTQTAGVTSLASGRLAARGEVTIGGGEVVGGTIEQLIASVEPEE